MAHITFIHGIANKPDSDTLHKLWKRYLSRNEGLDLGAEGVTSSMVYWADVLNENPQAEMAEHENNDSIIETGDKEIDLNWNVLSVEEQEWLNVLESRLSFRLDPPDGDENFTPSEADYQSTEFERIPLPWWLKRRLMKILLRDVHHYLFNAVHSPRNGVTYRVREEIRNRFIKAIKKGGNKEGPHLIIAHSMGTVIAYDCLKRVAECPEVDTLITIGSPLGLDEIQDKLSPEWSRENGFPEKVTSDWYNFYDRLDPVAAFDPVFANDYKKNGQKCVKDINEQNSGIWRHDLSNYFSGPELRQVLIRQLGFQVS